MASYEELKQQMMDDEAARQANPTQPAQQFGKPRSKSPDYSTVLLGAAALALIAGIVFGIPAFVDGQDTGKSKLQNRLAVLQWLCGDSSKEKKKKKSNTYGPFDSVLND